MGGFVDRQKILSLRQVGVGAGAQQLFDHAHIMRGGSGMDCTDFLDVLSALVEVERHRQQQVEHGLVVEEGSKPKGGEPVRSEPVRFPSALKSSAYAVDIADDDGL